jgi:hypothetical protein
MKEILKIAVIGSSFEGHEVAKDVFEKIDIGSGSVVILIPHICSGGVYRYLLNKKKNLSHFR